MSQLEDMKRDRPVEYNKALEAAARAGFEAMDKWSYSPEQENPKRIMSEGQKAFWRYLAIRHAEGVFGGEDFNSHQDFIMGRREYYGNSSTDAPSKADWDEAKFVTSEMNSAFYNAFGEVPGSGDAESVSGDPKEHFYGDESEEAADELVSDCFESSESGDKGFKPGHRVTVKAKDRVRCFLVAEDFTFESLFREFDRQGIWNPDRFKLELNVMAGGSEIEFYSGTFKRKTGAVRTA